MPLLENKVIAKGLSARVLTYSDYGSGKYWEDSAVKEVPISKCEVSQNSGCQQV